MSLISKDETLRKREDRDAQGGSNDPTDLSLNLPSTSMQFSMAPEMSNTRSAVTSVVHKVLNVLMMGQAVVRAGYVDQYVEEGTTEQEEHIATSRTVLTEDEKLVRASSGTIPAIDRSTDVWVSKERLERAVSVSTSKILTADARDMLNRYWLCQLKINYDMDKSLAHKAGVIFTPAGMEDHIYGVCIGEIRVIPTCRNLVQFAVLKSKKDISVSTAKKILTQVAGIQFEMLCDKDGNRIPSVSNRSGAYWSVDYISGCTDWLALMDHCMFPEEHERIVSTEGAEAWQKKLFDRLKPWNVKPIVIPTLPGISEGNAAKINQHISSQIDAKRGALVGEWDTANAYTWGLSAPNREDIVEKLYAIPDDFIAGVNERLN